jgi:HlyD family secretion protein
MSNTRLLFLGGIAAVVVGVIAVPRMLPQSPAPSPVAETGSDNISRSTARPVVQVARAETRPMRRTVRLTGVLKSSNEATLSPKQGGKVAAVLVKEGQSVYRGQPLVRLDDRDARGQADRAAAGVAAARAQWEKAQTGARLKQQEVERRVAEARRGLEQARVQLRKAEAGVKLQSRASQADVERAQAGLDAARSAAETARQGARPEERRRAELGVQQAERAVALTAKSLEDVQFIYDKGGLPRVKLDEARENHDKAQDGLAQARSQLDQVKNGPTPQQIAAADAQVRGAEAAVAAARVANERGDVDAADLAAAQGQVREAEAGVRAAEASRSELDLTRSDVRAARSGHQEALAALRLAQEQVAAAVLSSPTSGAVTQVNVNVGEMAGPGQPAVTIVGERGVYLEAAAPARLLSELRVGQRATVRVDAVPNRTFVGVVRMVGDVAGADGRSFPVRIDLDAPPSLLKPGAQARAEVSAPSSTASVTVPLAALHAEEAGAEVWLVRDGRVEAVKVEIPFQDDHHATVRGEIRAGDRVVLSPPPGVVPGQEVEIQLAASS